MSSDESVGERAVNHTWSVMSAIGGGAIVLLLANLLTCANGEIRFMFATTIEEYLSYRCAALLPGVRDNPFAPLVVAAVGALLVGAAVEFVVWLRTKHPT